MQSQRRKMIKVKLLKKTKLVLLTWAKVGNASTAVIKMNVRRMVTVKEEGVVYITTIKHKKDYREIICIGPRKAVLIRVGIIIDPFLNSEHTNLYQICQFGMEPKRKS